MTTSNTQSTPWHIWLIGGVSLLWNAMGGFDYIMTKTRNADYLAQFTPEQLDYFHTYPLVANIGWGLGVWGAILGSILLLIRSRWAVTAFSLSLFGLIITTIYSFFMSDGAKIMGTGGMIFSAVIFVIAVALLAYARGQAMRGVLR